MSFTFAIDNFSEKEAVIESPKFSSGGCQWFVEVFPKGYIVDDHLSLYLLVGNPESLRHGWERRASYSFALLNESGKELLKTTESSCQLFCDEFTGWGRTRAVPLRKLHRFTKKNKLIVKVYEAVDEGFVTGKETLDIRGFQVLYSQVVSVGRLFIEQPNVAANFKIKNKLVKTRHMNLLLGLIETLERPPSSFSEDELSNTRNNLIKLTEARFKLDWLKAKLDEVSLEWKKDDARVQELVEHIKNLTLELKEKGKTDAYATKFLPLAQMVSDLTYEVSDLKI
ncbi:unnamed protein product [Microthlaspi erraticum]|uniref:MATH domain-containing protein n=1 Tax=Microthlaspi erraticum TaxID=1685480 RepID=A0A6D2KHZ5_9BRAS|nr:unnamed protein product [Microthlaspi erraticum]